MARNIPGPVVSVSRGTILCDIDFQARVVHPQGGGQEILKEGFLVAPSDVDTVTATQWNWTTGQVVGPVSVGPDNFSATIINDDEWTTDLIGRNFLINVPGSMYPVPSEYRLIIDLILHGGARRLWAYERTVESLQP